MRVAAAAQVTAVAKMMAATTGMYDRRRQGRGHRRSPVRGDWEGTNAQMQALILVADNLSLRLGTTLPEAAKKWIVAGFDDPAKAAQTLVDELTGFDGILVEHLKELERSRASFRRPGPNICALFSKASAGANTNITQLQTGDQNARMRSGPGAGTGAARTMSSDSIGDLVQLAGFEFHQRVRGAIRAVTATGSRCPAILAIG